MKEQKKTGCVLVLYNPNKALLKDVLLAISNQVDEVFISDNSPNKTDFDFSDHNNIIYHFMNGNKGIATAQNVGIRYFEQLHYDFIFFLDQDSISPNSLVDKLYETYLFLKEKKIKVGAVGPRPYNRTENKKYEGAITKGTKITNNITETTELISSASLIPIENFQTVGYMEDDLFIDGVDFEWCWRAKKNDSLRFFIAEDVLLSHQLGEGDKKFLFKKVAIPTPFRTFFQFRNYFRLIRRNYVPIYWKIINGIKYFVKYFYYPLMVSPRIKYFKNINKGIIMGLLNKK